MADPNSIWKHPKQAEIDYANRIKRRIEAAKKMAQRAFGRVRSTYGLAINRRAERLRQDASTREIETAIRRSVRAAQKSFLRIHDRRADRDDIKRAAREVDDHNRQLLVERVSEEVETPSIPRRLPQALVSGWIAKNLSEIESIREEFFDDLEDELVAGLRDGERLESIADRFESIAGGSKRHAELLARDQFGSLNAQVNKHRQEQVGIERYRWRTSGDTRVRDSHEDLDGEAFTWADGAPGEGHPGEPINCRCTPDPILEDIIRNDSFLRHFKQTSASDPARQSFVYSA
jgi:SPP1 gp7 family putative phage head morphogenesis protein